MSYNGRRGPNVSQFMANLNSVEPLPADDPFNGQDDLSLFANTDFFDFDMGDNISTNFDISSTDRKSSSSRWNEPTSPAQADFLNTDFSFADLQSFPSIDASGANANGSFMPAGLSSSITSPVSATSPTASSTAKVGEKRKSIAPQSVDENARVAAEEDKRRRNTAASARFRVKKKQREQALEKTAREMTEKAAMLETKVQQLEMENKWLKGLITERDLGGEMSVKTVGKVALDEMYEKFKREEKGGVDADGESD